MLKYSQTIAQKDEWSKDRISKMTPEQKAKLTDIIVKTNPWLPIEPKKRKDRIYWLGLVYVRFLLWYSGEDYDKEYWGKKFTWLDTKL